MPYELSRRNQKTAQRYVENSTKDLLAALGNTVKVAARLPPSSPAGATTTASDATSTSTAAANETLASLDSMLSKMQGLKRKLESLHDEELRIHRSNRARLTHWSDLYTVQSLVDVKYDEWSRVRLSRLLVDYLLREGYSQSAAHLAKTQDIEELVDVDAFVACHKIEKSLREERSTALALAWCKENGKELKKQGSMLEFELRLQQYIELVRQGHEGRRDVDMDGEMEEDEGMNGNGVSLDLGQEMPRADGKLLEARAHVKKYLVPSGDFELLGRAASLLAYKPSTLR